MRDDIRLDSTMMDLMVLMAEGNPGGLTAMAELLKDEPDRGLALILGLDDMNIRGTQIWIAYKDYCNQDIKRFAQAIEERDPVMVNMVNERSGILEMAVTSGGSIRR